LADNDVDRLLDQLGRLGAVEVCTGVVTATPLGVGLVAGHLRDLGVPVPSLDELLDETAEVLVATAAGAPPQTAATLMDAWCEPNGAKGHAELRALAARTDDPVHRRLAKTYAKR
jgi:hypothetical protein